MIDPPPLTDDYILLAGQPSVTEFIKFVKLRASSTTGNDDRTLLREWETAQQHLRETEESTSAGLEVPAWTPLPTDMAESVTSEESGDSGECGRLTSGLLPSRWALVELDRVIVCQRHINLTFASQLRDRMGDRPSAQELVRIAMGSRWAAPPVTAIKVSENTYSFSSRSADLRFLDIAALDAAAAAGTRRGSASHAIGIFVGFGPNMISAFEINRRLILTNGSHRAYALRASGVRHVPCLIETLPADQARDLVGDPELRQHFGLYAAGPRPPLFRDYFDERLFKTLRVPRASCLLYLRINIEYLKSAMS